MVVVVVEVGGQLEASPTDWFGLPPTIVISASQPAIPIRDHGTTSGPRLAEGLNTSDVQVENKLYMIQTKHDDYGSLEHDA